MAKKLPKQDPHAAREAEKYENPIPSREFILEMLAGVGEPMGWRQIAKHLDLHQDDQVEALQRRLRAMERDGQLILNRRNGYCILEKTDLLAGRVIGHPDGFGFMVLDEGGDDLYIGPREMRQVFHGDRVVARVAGIDRRGRREAAIVDVLERANSQLVGRYYSERGVGYVVPDNKRISQDILIAQEDLSKAKEGQFVVVEIVEQPTTRHEAIARIVDVLGDHMAPGMEIDIAIRSHDLPKEWPVAVQEEIKIFSEEVPEQAKQGRLDLRAVPLVTIDGEDARDFDDAVYCERHGKGWRLLVAIADVSSYVAPGTALDMEARKRGNSVYFPGEVIPMLPEILSNGLCSINPKVDRLCMVCELFISPAGIMQSYKFHEAVMCSHARLTYNKVAAMLVDKDEALRAEYQAVLPHLEDLYALYQSLLGQRSKRGAIEFETTETRIVFDATRKIERIVPVERNDAHRLIEECMLAANVAAADFLHTNKIPVVYRNHQGPTVEKLADLRAFLSELGLQLGGGNDPEPKHYAKLLASIQERPDARLVQTVLLRSMSQAVYSPENVGHFGLAYEAYTHFTSPIRRYPDLVVHRAIRHVLSGKPVEKFVYDNEAMLMIGDHCSLTERRADEATRDATDWLKCEFMLDKVEQEFDGLVTGVTGFGLFVELKEIYVEGLVHITSLPIDYYHFDAGKHRLVGERTSRTFRLADKVRVRVIKVDLDDRKVDFEMVVDQVDQGEKPAKKKRRRSK